MFRASCFLSAAVILIDRKIRVSLFCHEPTLRYQFSIEEKQFTRLNRPILVQDTENGARSGILTIFGVVLSI